MLIKNLSKAGLAEWIADYCVWKIQEIIFRTTRYDLWLGVVEDEFMQSSSLYYELLEAYEARR